MEEVLTYYTDEENVLTEATVKVLNAQWDIVIAK